RDAWLNRQGYRVLRLSTAEVQGNLATVCDRIEFELSPPSPALPPSRGKGDLAPSRSIISPGRRREAGCRTGGPGSGPLARGGPWPPRGW
ncbi:MAG: DUF559 domain-containing protein, partial [Caulobacteraceae bacterium]